MRVINRSPYPGEMVGRVVAWTAMTLPLHESWEVTVDLMTTDWFDRHDEGGIAYPDRRGAFIYIPRETLDPWSYIVHVGGHEIRHLQQFEARTPGCSTKDPDPDTDQSIETIVENVVRAEKVSSDIEDDVMRQALEAAKFRQRDIEDDAEAAGLERLRFWTDVLTISERDAVRFGQFAKPNTFWS